MSNLRNTLLKPHNLKIFLEKNFNSNDTFTSNYLKILIEKKEGVYLYNPRLLKSLEELVKMNFLSIEYKSVDNRTVQYYKMK